VALSDKAFKELTEYFENSDREVIICMVGDHAPSFATELAGNIDMEKTFTLRSTPYIIWSNSDIKIDVPQLTSMPYMAPMVLETAGCNTSPFYQYMSEMQKEVPVITAFGLYKTKDGEVFNYEDDADFKETVDTYFDMVYNNASPDAQRIQSIFMPYK